MEVESPLKTDVTVELLPDAIPLPVQRARQSLTTE